LQATVCINRLRSAQISGSHFKLFENEQMGVARTDLLNKRDRVAFTTVRKLRRARLVNPKGDPYADRNS